MPRKLVTAVMSPIVAVAVAAVAALSTAGAATAAAAPPSSVTMSCGSANPLFWAPSFTWNLIAVSGASRPDGNSEFQPSLGLAGGNELPYPQGFSIGTAWYGTQVVIDWHNETTGKSGRAVSDQQALQQNPGIPVNSVTPGVGTVNFTATVQTGAGWWFVNTQNAVCKGSISIVPV